MNIDIQVSLQAGKSNHIDIANLIKLSSSNCEPGVLKPATGESPSRFRAVFAEGAMQRTDPSAGVSPDISKSTEDEEPPWSFQLNSRDYIAPKYFLDLAAEYSVQDLASEMEVTTYAITRRVDRAVAKVAESSGKPRDQVKADLERRRLANGVIEQARFDQSVKSRTTRAAKGP